MSLLSNSIDDLNARTKSTINITSSQNLTNLIEQQQGSNNNQTQSNHSIDNTPWITIPVHIQNIDSFLSKIKESPCRTISQPMDFIMQKLSTKYVF
jgi:hypothetical protein